MHELALGFLLLLVGRTAPGVHVVPADAVTRWAPADPCVEARRISEQGACLRPEDCGAFEGWMRMFGAPRTEPLEPALAERGRRPATFLCPAAAAEPADPGG